MYEEDSDIYLEKYERLRYLGLSIYGKKGRNIPWEISTLYHEYMLGGVHVQTMFSPNPQRFKTVIINMQDSM